MGFDLTNDSDVNLIVSEVYSSENDEYRREIDKQWRILRGDLKYFVEQHLKSIFPKTHRSFTPSDINLAKKITDKRATAYKEEPTRELETDSDTSFYDEVLFDAGSKWIWRDFDTYKNYFKYAAMWFSFFEKEGRQVVKLRALRPNQFSRIVNDKDETEVFIVHLGNGGMDATHQVRGDGQQSNIQDQPEDNTSRKLAIWTKTHHVVINVEHTTGSKKIKREPIEGNEEMVNELGMIPAIFDQEGSTQELPALNALADQTINANFILSTIITGMASQAFGQLVVTHAEGVTVPDNLQQGLFTFLKLEQPLDGPATSADYISPSPDLSNMMQVYRNYVGDVLEEHGVTGGEAVDGSQKFTSGLDRLLSEMDTTEIIEMNQESYVQRENELYHLFKQFYALTGQYNFRSQSLTVIFKRPAPMMGEKELLEIIKMNLELGIIEKWEALTMKNPNLSREEAIDKLELIDAAKQKRKEAFNADIKERSDQESESERSNSRVSEGEEQREDETEDR